MDGKERKIREYFNCWLNKDERKLDELLADDIYYSECYGPKYYGLHEVKAWFKAWNQAGSVERWDIKDVFGQGNKAAVEWYFKCNHMGQESQFNGASIVLFDEKGKIKSIKEFESKL